MEFFMEYGYCQFCEKNKIGYKKSGLIGDKKIEWFICLDCDRILYSSAATMENFNKWN